MESELASEATSIRYTVGRDCHLYVVARDGEWFGWFRLGKLVLGDSGSLRAEVLAP